MKELSMVRIIVAGLLLITVLIVCKRIWRQFFYSKKYKKYLSHLLEKENKYIYCRLRKLRVYNWIIPSESCHVGRFASDVFR